MDYNKETNRENGFSEGLNVFVQERIANRIFYRIITKGNGVYIPTMSILFEDVCIAYLGDIERTERYGGIRFCFPMPDMNFHG
ncbi:MAG: hypothetical protein LBH00_07445 [Planctomycetaceae bacterium]|nr:hypothetical protein [Planctomycetaceae bacterium]